MKVKKKKKTLIELLEDINKANKQLKNIFYEEAIKTWERFFKKHESED